MKIRIVNPLIPLLIVAVILISLITTFLYGNSLQLTNSRAQNVHTPQVSCCRQDPNPYDCIAQGHPPGTKQTRFVGLFYNNCDSANNSYGNVSPCSPQSFRGVRCTPPSAPTSLPPTLPVGNCTFENLGLCTRECIGGTCDTAGCTNGRASCKNRPPPSPVSSKCDFENLGTCTQTCIAGTCSTAGCTNGRASCNSRPSPTITPTRTPTNPPPSACNQSSLGVCGSPACPGGKQCISVSAGNLKTYVCGLNCTPSISPPRPSVSPVTVGCQDWKDGVNLGRVPPHSCCSNGNTCERDAIGNYGCVVQGCANAIPNPNSSPSTNQPGVTTQTCSVGLVNYRVGQKYCNQNTKKVQTCKGSNDWSYQDCGNSGCRNNPNHTASCLNPSEPLVDNGNNRLRIAIAPVEYSNSNLALADAQVTANQMVVLLGNQANRVNVYVVNDNNQTYVSGSTNIDLNRINVVGQSVAGADYTIVIADPSTCGNSTGQNVWGYAGYICGSRLPSNFFPSQSDLQLLLSNYSR